jgi:S-adenosylmethionine synthetase
MPIAILASHNHIGDNLNWAVVALREWHAPAFLESGVSSRPTAVIDQARVLDLAVRSAAAYGHFGRTEQEFTW